LIWAQGPYRLSELTGYNQRLAWRHTVTIRPL